MIQVAVGGEGNSNDVYQIQFFTIQEMVFKNDKKSTAKSEISQKYS